MKKEFSSIFVLTSIFFLTQTVAKNQDMNHAELQKKMAFPIETLHLKSNTIVTNFYIPFEKLNKIPANDEINVQATEDSDTFCNQLNFNVTEDKIILKPIAAILTRSIQCVFDIYNIKQNKIATFNVNINN